MSCYHTWRHYTIHDIEWTPSYVISPHIHVWLLQAEMASYSELIRKRKPTLHHCFGFVDGVCLQVMEPNDQEQQNAYFNGWKNCCNISNVICFAPDGCIIWARYNCPGMSCQVMVCHHMTRRIWHDVLMSYHCNFIYV